MGWAQGAPYTSKSQGTFSPDPKTHMAASGMETDYSPAGCSTVKVLNTRLPMEGPSGVYAYGDPKQPPLFGIAKAYFDPLGIFFGYGWPQAATAIWALGWNAQDGKALLIGVPSGFSYPGWFPPYNAYPILAVTDDTQAGLCGYRLDAAPNAECLVSWQPDNPQAGRVTGGVDSTAFDNTWTGVLYVQSRECPFYSALNGKRMDVRLHN